MSANKFISYLLYTTMLSALVSCNNGTESHKEQPNTFNYQTSFPNNSIYNLGGTYDTSSGMPTSQSSCLSYGNNLDNINIITPSAKLDFTQSVDYRTIKNSMGFDFEAELDLGIDKVKIEQHYAKTSRDDNLHMNINYIYKYTGKAVFNHSIDIQGENTLTTPAFAALHTNPEAFRRLCGDRFVSELDAGVTVLIRLTLNFNSHSEKNSFDSEAADLGGLQGVLTKLKNKEKGTQFTITASGLQLGGNPTLLNQLFIKHGGKINEEGYPEVNCSGRDSDNNNCAELMDSIIDYAASVSQQIHNKTDYHYSNPVLSTWKSIGIDVNMPYIAPEIRSAIIGLNAMIASDLHTQEVLNDYLAIYKQNNINPILIAQISNIQSMYKDIIASYDNQKFNLGETCATGYITKACIDSINAIKEYRNNTLKNNQELINVANYLMESTYSGKLLTSYSGKQYIECDLIPASFATTHQYLIDCDGQITFNENISDSLIIRKENQNLFVNNLNYSFIDNFTPITFSYDMKKINYALKPDKSLDFIYQNKTDILANESQIINEPLIIINSPW